MEETLERASSDLSISMENVKESTGCASEASTSRCAFASIAFILLGTSLAPPFFLEVALEDKDCFFDSQAQARTLTGQLVGKLHRKAFLQLTVRNDHDKENIPEKIRRRQSNPERNKRHGKAFKSSPSGVSSRLRARPMYLRKHLLRGTPAEKSPIGRSSKPHSNLWKGRGGNLKHMKETPPSKGKGAPNPFYYRPTDDKGGPCHAPDCDGRSSCLL